MVSKCTGIEISNGLANLDTSPLWTTFPGREADSISCADIGESDNCNSIPCRALARYRYCRCGMSSARSVRGSASLARRSQPMAIINEVRDQARLISSSYVSSFNNCVRVMSSRRPGHCRRGIGRRGVGWHLLGFLVGVGLLGCLLGSGAAWLRRHVHARILSVRIFVGVLIKFADCISY